MEETILNAEGQVAELEAQLNEPSFYIDHAAETPALIEKMNAKKAEVARLYERWEELEAIRVAAESA